MLSGSSPQSKPATSSNSSRRRIVTATLAPHRPNEGSCGFGWLAGDKFCEAAQFSVRPANIDVRQSYLRRDALQPGEQQDLPLPGGAFADNAMTAFTLRDRPAEERQRVG